MSRQYTDEEVERGLGALVLNSGSVARAQENLAEQGLDVPYGTLRSWAKYHHERYQRIEAELLPQVKARLAELHTDLAKRQIEVSDQLTERLRGEVKNLPPREIAGAARNMSVSAGVHTDKAAALRNEPAHITETRTYVEVTAKLAKFGLIEQETEERTNGKEEQKAIEQKSAA